MNNQINRIDYLYVLSAKVVFYAMYKAYMQIMASFCDQISTSNPFSLTFF